jgi:hypothetical protein
MKTPYFSGKNIETTNGKAHKQTEIEDRREKNTGKRIFPSPLCYSLSWKPLPGFPLALGNGFLYRIPYKPVIPFKVKGLFSPYHRFDNGFHLIVTGFANVPMGHVVVCTLADGGGYVLIANITSQTFHSNSSF